MQQHLQTAHLAPSHAQRVGGMYCPDCRGFIPVGIEQLLYDGGVACPRCGLALTIDQARSKQALDALAKVELAVRKVRETEHFNR